MTEIVLPVYVAVDVSASMAGEAATEIERVLADIHRTVVRGGEVANRLRIGYLQFADHAHVLVPVPDHPVPDPFSVTGFGGTTNSTALFTLLPDMITRDVDRFARAGALVCRPVVLLVTDGQFDAGWEPAFRDLTEYDTLTSQGFPHYPFVVPLGIGTQDGDMLRLAAHPPFIAGLAEDAYGREGAVLEALGEMLNASFIEAHRPPFAGIEDRDDFI